MTLDREILEQRIAGRRVRRDLQRVVIDDLDEARLSRHYRGPNMTPLIDGTENRHLAEFEKLRCAGRKMIDDAFANILGDVADARAFLNGNFAAMKFHAVLSARAASPGGGPASLVA